MLLGLNRFFDNNGYLHTVSRLFSLTNKKVKGGEGSKQQVIIIPFPIGYTFLVHHFSFLPCRLVLYTTGLSGSNADLDFRLFILRHFDTGTFLEAIYLDHVYVPLMLFARGVVDLQ
jgi:hypothetical protein